MPGAYGAPRDYLPAPPNEQDRFGLFSVASFPDPGPVRWLHGIEWEPTRGVRAQGRVADCVDHDYNEQLTLTSGEPLARALPFIVAAEYRCKATSRPVADAEQRALDHLALGEQRAVERAVATGELGNEPSLSDATDITPVPGTAIPLKLAVGLLEEALSTNTGQVGVIHAQRRYAAHIASLYLVASGRARGETMETKLGNLWSFGGGYTGVVPEGASAPGTDELWLAATPRPLILRSEPWTQPDEDKYVRRSDNELAILAQRHYLVSWPYGTYAVLTSLNGAD